MANPSTQTQKKVDQEPTQTNNSNPSLPELPKQEIGSNTVKIKGGRSFEIKIDSESLIGFAYQVKTDSGTARGEFPAKGPNTIEIKDHRLSYTRNKDGVLDLKVDSSVHGITAIVHDKSGGVSRIDLIKNGVVQNQSVPLSAPPPIAPEKPAPIASPAEPAKIQEPIVTLSPVRTPSIPTPAPEVNLDRDKTSSNPTAETILSKTPPLDQQKNAAQASGNIFGGQRTKVADPATVIQLPPPPNLPRADISGPPPANSKVSIPEQAKPKTPIPADIMVKAQIEGLDKREFDLIKKDEATGRFSFCKGKTCIDLGYSGAEKPNNATTPSANTQDAKSLPSTTPTKAPELSLSNIPANAKLKYEIQYPDGKGRGEIDLSKYSGFPVTMGSIGTFSKNSDGTIKFEAIASFNGKIGLGENLVAPKTAAPLSAKPTQETSKDLQTGAHVTPAQAKEYLKAHPNEDVIVVVTDPPNCAPCRNYDPLLPGIIKGLTNRAKVLIVDHAFERNGIGEFNVSGGVPATLHYQAGRSNPTSYARHISGPTVLERVQEMLNRGRGGS